MDICFEGIRTETESSFDRQLRDMEFCYEVAEQHREMERFINECLIKASGNKKAINEMYIIQESAFGDKIKGFFTKIKNFFKKIFDKLGASLTGLFAEQKKYIDKYSNIITKCKWVAGDINDVKDRFKGVPRITDAVDNVETAIIGNNMDKYFKGEKIDNNDGGFIDTSVFTSAESITKAYNDEKNRKKLEIGATRDQMYNEFINNGYWSKLQDFASYKESDSNGNVDIKTTFASWFDGSKDTISWSADEVENNFQTIINVSYAGQSYIKKLERIVTSVTKKMDDASKAMENYHKAQQDKIMQAVKGTASATPKPENDAIEQAKKDAEQVKNANETEEGFSYSFNSRFDKYINEMDIVQSSSSSSKPSAPVPKNTGTTNINSATKANEKVNSLQTNNMNAKDVKNTTGNVDDNIKKYAEELLNVDITNRQLKINESVNISTTIVNRMFDSFKNTNSDFFNIIKAHVQWYLSNPGKESESDNQVQRSRSLDINAGNAPATNPTPSNNAATKNITNNGKVDEVTKRRNELNTELNELKEKIGAVAGVKGKEDEYNKLIARRTEINDILTGLQ